MFDVKSRYAALPVAKMTVVDSYGKMRDVQYVTRRFLPAANQMTTILEHTVAQGERLDHIATKYLGDPLLFWRVCDANNVLRPEALIETHGQTIEIALPNS